MTAAGGTVGGTAPAGPSASTAPAAASKPEPASGNVEPALDTEHTFTPAVVTMRQHLGADAGPRRRWSREDLGIAPVVRDKHAEPDTASGALGSDRTDARGDAGGRKGETGAEARSVPRHCCSRCPKLKQRGQRLSSFCFDSGGFCFACPLRQNTKLNPYTPAQR